MNQRPAHEPEKVLGGLLSLYERHLHSYDKWLSMARDAETKLDAGELDEFLNVHEEKQSVTEQLQKEDGRLRRERRHVTKALGLADFTLQQLDDAVTAMPDNRAFARVVAEWHRLLERLDRTMRQVAAVEKGIERKLRTHLRELSDSASNARTTRRAVRAYYADGEGHDARFIDRKS